MEIKKISHKEYIIEACVESFDQAFSAYKGGADRLELCCQLDEGGLYPGESLIQKLVKEIPIPIMIMIRPRPGNFEYSAKEISIMESQIDYCLNAKVHGIVFGCSRGNQLDIQAISRLLERSKHLSVTIHKVVDEINDPLQNIHSLKSLGGIDRVLSSGGKSTAWEGREILKEMQLIAGDSFSIMPGGKVTPPVLNKLHDYYPFREYHGRMII